MAKAKMGRPRLPKARRKGEILTLRLAPADLRAIEVAAERAGQRVSAWARARLLESAASPGPST